MRRAINIYPITLNKRKYCLTELVKKSNENYIRVYPNKRDSTFMYAPGLNK